MPFENFCPSVKANCGAWQLAQETVLSTESRLSKYRSQPSSAFSGEYGLSFGHMMGVSPSGTLGPSLGNIVCEPSADRTLREGRHTTTARRTNAMRKCDGEGMFNLIIRNAEFGVRHEIRTKFDRL